MDKTQIDAPAGVPFIEVRREFEAPLDLVWKAFTTPELLKQWLGPAKYEMVIEEYDVRDGGRWRYIHRGPDGEFGFHGVFHGEPSPDGFTQTFEFDGAPGNVSLDRLTLEAAGGQTIARTHSVYQSIEARDAMVAGGMAEGLSQGFDRLDAVLGAMVPVA